jgi:plasmid maintenance system antidote protein VapI
MENEFSNVLKTAMKFASALGKHEGNIKFILNEQHQLTKADIIKYLQETYDEVNSILSQE